MWNSFCCKDCGSHSYCDHKMNIAQNIYTTINNEQEERTYRDMEQLSIEEQFNIYADIVPPPSLPASQPPAEVYPGSSKKQQQKQQQKSQKYPPSKVASSSSTTSSSILSASYHKDTCLPSQQQAQQKHKEERLLETQDEGETEEKEANDDDDEEEELSTRKRRVVVVGGGDGDGKLKHVVKHQQESSFDMPMEDPVHIDKCLREMMEEIDDKTKPSNKVAYLQALQISPTYVQDKKFWLSFLRADYYNVKDASKRLIHHFEFKKELFCCGGGSSSNSNQNNLEILGRDVTLDDLTEEERQMLTETNKAFELKREYDPLGRSILIGRGQYVRYDNPLGMVSYCFHLNLLRLLRDQKRTFNRVMLDYVLLRTCACVLCMRFTFSTQVWTLSLSLSLSLAYSLVSMRNYKDEIRLVLTE